jgi:protein-tyrosine phosphatase
LLDGAGNNLAILRAAIRVTATLLTGGVPTLVTCGGGMSRSPAVAAAALASIQGRPVEEALLNLAHHGPHDVTPGLWTDLKKLI